MSPTTINVTKRDGSKEPYDVSKIQKQIEHACEGIIHVSQSMIEMKMDLELYNGITTTQIDKLAVNAAASLIMANDGHVNYQYPAGRLLNGMLRKQVFGSFEVPRLYDIIQTNVSKGLYTEELLDWYSEDEWDTLDGFVDHEKDEKLTYAAISQLMDKYLVRNRATGEIVETPQVRYIVAAATAMHAEKTSRMKKIRDYYRNASSGKFTLATPVLAGLGTKTKQFSSCVLLKSDDTLDSIFATGEMVAKYSAKRAGIGLEIGRLRPAGAPIRGGEVAHTGLTMFIKKWFADMRSCSQGGLRNSSATVTYPIWHYEFEELIVLKNNQGTEENRVRHLDYSVVTSKYFWNKFKNKENMTFFDPNEVPDLYEAYYRNQTEFIKLYEKYEKSPKLRKRVLNATDVFNLLLGERTDTGRIYMVFIDNVIDGTPFNTETDPIYQSNLCQEILLPTRPFQRLEDPTGRIALCTLGSLTLGKFKKPEDMKNACHTLIRSLDNLLTYQDFLSIHADKSNEEFRPLGVGICDLAHWHAQRNLKYGSEEALKELGKWMEHIIYYCTEASIELAEEHGPCSRWMDTVYGKGKFPVEYRSEGLSEIYDEELKLDWNALRVRMAESGIRNATILAVAPVESSSVVVDATNGIELPKALITNKDSRASSLIQVVPEYEKLKNNYQLMWDQTDCIDYLKTAAVISAYVCQSISTNTFYDPKNYEGGKIPGTLIAKNLMLYQKWGGKTIYYSLVNKVGIKQTIKPTTSNEQVDDLIEIDDEESCSSCVL